MRAGTDHLRRVERCRRCECDGSAAALYNPADNIAQQMGVGVGGSVGLGAPANTNLPNSYAGPAPGLAGVDQVNGLYFPEPLEVAIPLPEGCHVSLWLAPSGPNDLDSQQVNVSIHSGGGACVDPPLSSLAIVTWQQTMTSQIDGVSYGGLFELQLFQGSGPSYCAASYPTSPTAGTVMVAGHRGTIGAHSGQLNPYVFFATSAAGDGTRNLPAPPPEAKMQLLVRPDLL